MGSNLNQRITKHCKILTDDGFSFPALFIVDKDGIIQYHTVNNLLGGLNINKLLQILTSIQYIKKNPGHECGVDRQFGNKILCSYPLKSKIYFKKSYSKKKN